MDFKKNIIAGLALATLSMNGFAGEMNAGTIHFTGEIIESSCTIQGDDGTDSTIPLGTYPTSLFTTVGKETALKEFSITLANCPLTSAGLPAVQLTFNGPTPRRCWTSVKLPPRAKPRPPVSALPSARRVKMINSSRWTALKGRSISNWRQNPKIRLKLILMPAINHLQMRLPPVRQMLI